ncbi:hypothetical protein KR084_005039 [Drosophila pseudotakahashii]|nr:hypothetical protein KR084_005039 [Drosophila pseudotakahashii]
MRSLRRGITSATAGGFRKISPKGLLGQNCSPLLSWCPSLQPPSNNFVKNLGASPKYGNYLRFIEDPELPKLIKLYDRVCRDCHKIPVGSAKLRRSELDDPPKKHWHKNHFPKGKIPVGSIKHKRNELDDLPRKNWIKGDSSKYTIDLGNKDFPKDSVGVRKIPVGSTKLKQSELDDWQRKAWDKSGSPNSLDIDNFTNLNRSTILETKKSERSFINSEDPVNYDLNNPSKKSRKKSNSHKSIKNIQNGSPVKSRNPTKSNKMSLKRTQLPKVSLYDQRKSKTQSKSNRNSVRNPFNMGGTKHLAKRYRTKPFKIGSHIFKRSRNNLYKIRKRSMKSRSHVLQNIQFKSASAEVSDDDTTNKSINDDNSDKGEVFRGVSQSDNVSSISWLPRTDFYNINPGPIDLIHFGPIDIETHKKDFLTLHRIEPAGKRGWSKIPWPNSFEPRQRNARIDDRQSASPKGRLLTKKTVSSPRRAVYSRKFSKFHSFRFEICPRKRRRARKTVSCQTEVNRNICELCDICRPNSQPEEPFMVEMKKRQDREELKSYYLKMIKRNKECCKEKVSDEEAFLNPLMLGISPTLTSSSEPNTSCKSNLGGMRHQLEQCLDMLSLCGRLIEDRLRLSRIETRCRP